MYREKTMKIKKRNIILLTLFVTGFISGQIKDDLKEYKIPAKLKKYGIDLNDFILKSDFEIKYYNEGFITTDNNDSIIIKRIRAFDKKDIFVETYKFIPSDYSKNHDEYFVINGDSIFLDTIINKDKIKLKYYNPYFYFRESYLFKDEKKNKEFILIQTENRTFYRNKSVISYFVIILNKDKVDIHLLYDVDKSKVVNP